MALIIRFVNTASTAGGDGTTNATTGVNRAYASLSEWEAAEETDLVAAGDIAEVKCSGAQDSTAVTIDGWVTGASNYILINAPDDKPLDGVFDPLKYFIDIGTTGNPLINCNDEFVRFKDLQFRRASLASSSLDRPCINFPATLSTGHIEIERNIFKSIASDISGTVSGISVGDSTPTYTIKNNTLYDFNGTSDKALIVGASSPVIQVYNNTFINNLEAIQSKSSMVIKNNIFQDNTTDLSGAQNGSNDYNLTDNVSIPGGNSVANSTLVFEDKANDNFALAAGDTDAIGAGIGPSSDVNVPTDDIIGTARSGATTDIGAFVFVGGSGITLTVDSTMPSMLSAGAFTQTLPAFSASISSVMPSMTSAAIFTQSEPVILNASILSIMPSMESSVSANQLPPGNNSDIASTMPSMVSAALFGQTVPEFNNSISSVMPSMVSSAQFQNLTPGNNSSISSTMPSMISSGVFTVEDPKVLDAAITSLMPSMQSSATFFNGVIGIVIGEGNNIDIVVKSRNINIQTKSRNI